MTLQQVIAAIKQGKTVCVGSEVYQVKQDNKGQYNIICTLNGYTIGLTWSDGVTLNCKESELFINERY